MSQAGRPCFVSPTWGGAQPCREKPLRGAAGLGKEKLGRLGRCVQTPTAHTHSPPAPPLQTPRRRCPGSHCSGFSETSKATAAH